MARQEADHAKGDDQDWNGKRDNDGRKDAGQLREKCKTKQDNDDIGELVVRTLTGIRAVHVVHRVDG